MKILFKTLVFSVFTLILSSCNLGLQDEFNFTDENDFGDSFADITALEFINSRKSPSIEFNIEGRKKLIGTELDLMAAAIKLVGYEDFYNNENSTNRTFLLLTNEAFAGNTDRSLFNLVTGNTYNLNSFVDVDELIGTIDTPEEINRLKAILKYHIVSTKVAQVPTLVEREVDYTFSTLLPQVNENGTLSTRRSTMTFSRDIRWRIDLNTAVSLPRESTSTRVTLHNYVFSNGIAHHLEQTIGFQNYNLYSDLSVD